MHILSEDFLRFGEIIFFVKLVVNFEKGFFAVFMYEHSLRFCGVRAVIALNIEAFVTAFDVGTFVTAVNAFFGTAGHVRAFFIG